MARLNRQFNYLMLAFLVLNILIKSIGARFFFDYSYSFSPFLAIFAKFGRVLSTIYISRVALSWSYTTSHVLNMCSNGVWIYNEASQICQPTKNVFFCCSMKIFPVRATSMTTCRATRSIFPLNIVFLLVHLNYCLVQQHTYLPEISRINLRFWLNREFNDFLASEDVKSRRWRREATWRTFIACRRCL